MPQKMLVALDGTRPSESVLSHVSSLLKLIDADVTLLRVLPRASVGDEAQARSYLESLARPLRQKGVFVETAVACGKPADKILEALEKGRYTLLALSSRRKKGLRRIVLGSVAEEILRRTPVPVFVTAPSPEGSPPPSAPRTIVVPLDGSHRSAAVLEPVADLAQAAGARVSFVTVVSPTDPEELPVETAARTLFSRQKALERRGLSVELAVLFGDPVNEILRFAESRAADLIALATHGRTGLNRWRYGSITEAILRKSRVPLLVVRSTAQLRSRPLRSRAVEARRRALETAAGSSLSRSPYRGG
jgi:nucleotide-binding universal stress UspA family protein